MLKLFQTSESAFKNRSVFCNTYFLSFFPKHISVGWVMNRKTNFFAKIS